MKFSKEIPPVYQKCHDLFGVDWDRGIVITYGDTVYCKFDIPKHLEEHEAVHIIQQQNYGVEAWWERYFKDKDFRLEQEVPAYKAQISFIKKTVKDRNEVARMIHQLRQDMVNLYGGMCTSVSEARRLTMV